MKLVTADPNDDTNSSTEGLARNVAGSSLRLGSASKCKSDTYQEGNYLLQVDAARWLYGLD